jgi:hypothetical protein
MYACFNFSTGLHNSTLVIHDDCSKKSSECYRNNDSQIIFKGNSRQHHDNIDRVWRKNNRANT